MPTEQEKIAIQTLLTRKKLDEDIFFSSSLTLDDPFKAHVAWAYDNIYSKPYPFTRTHENFPRPYHGVAHVTRAAIYSTVWLNLYRKYGDQDALALSERDARLLQLALLFHDAAREDDDVDRWDHESGLLLYYYLIHTLNVEPDQAKIIAEAVANKDSKNSYHELVLQADGTVSWVLAQARPKNIYQKIIHDADCLDIIRARDHFEAEYLDFYQEIAQRNPIAMQDMAELITEARSLIENQGDGRRRLNTPLKLHYDTPECYQLTLDCLAQKTHNNYCIINAMSHFDPLFPSLDLHTPVINLPAYHPEQGLNNNNLHSAMREGKVFVRGVGTPSALLPNKHHETNAELEVYKMWRRLGQRTRTKKSNNTEKHGNPLRSTSLLHYGSGAFSSTGFLFIDLSIDHIQECHNNDFGSGYGKKIHYDIAHQSLSLDTKQLQLERIRAQQMKGGHSQTFFGANRFASNHNEIIITHLTQANAIYYTNDPTHHTTWENLSYSQHIRHPHSALLQAVYLQQVYENITGIKLPLLKYSWIHHTLAPQNNLTEEELLEHWTTMCRDYLENLIINNQPLGYLNVRLIKILSMYLANRVEADKYTLDILPADNYYSPEFKDTLDLRIEKMLIEHKQRASEKFIEMLLKEPALIQNHQHQDRLLSFITIPDSLKERINQYAQEKISTHFQHETMEIILYTYKVANRFSMTELAEETKKYLLIDIIKKNKDFSDNPCGFFFKVDSLLKENTLLQKEFGHDKAFKASFEIFIADALNYAIGIKDNFGQKTRLLINLITEANHSITADDKQKIIYFVLSTKITFETIENLIKILYALKAEESLFETFIANFLKDNKTKLSIQSGSLVSTLAWLKWIPNNCLLFENNFELFSMLISQLENDFICPSDIIRLMTHIVDNALHGTVPPTHMKIVREKFSALFSQYMRSHHHKNLGMLQLFLNDNVSIQLKMIIAPEIIAYINQVYSQWRTNSPEIQSKALAFIKKNDLIELAKETPLWEKIKPTEPTPIIEPKMPDDIQPKTIVSAQPLLPESSPADLTSPAQQRMTSTSQINLAIETINPNDAQGDAPKTDTAQIAILPIVDNVDILAQHEKIEEQPEIIALPTTSQHTFFGPKATLPRSEDIVEDNLSRIKRTIKHGIEEYIKNHPSTDRYQPISG